MFNDAANKKIEKLKSEGYTACGIIFMSGKNRVTVDKVGRVQHWIIDDSGKMIALDKVNDQQKEKPNYYDASGISVIEVISSKLTPEQFEGFCLGNAIKYALRANHKSAYKSDIKKLADYAGWLNDSVNS